jgi:Ca2+-binding EF-hand superfamily protein
MSQNEFMEWSRVNIVTYLSSKTIDNMLAIESNLKSSPLSLLSTDEDVNHMNKLLQLASAARQESENGEAIFKAFDLNGDGKVNLSEIKEVLVSGVEDEQSGSCVWTNAYSASDL